MVRSFSRLPAKLAGKHRYCTVILVRPTRSRRQAVNRGGYRLRGSPTCQDGEAHRSERTHLAAYSSLIGRRCRRANSPPTGQARALECACYFTISSCEFYSQMNAPTWMRGITLGELRYRWTETGSLDLYRHAHAFDHIAGSRGVMGKATIL